MGTQQPEGGQAEHAAQTLEGSGRPVVLVAAGDLLFMSKVRGVAAHVGVDVVAARRGAPLPDEVARTGASLVVLDLASPHFGGAEAVAALRAGAAPGNAVEVVAYCNHVLVDAMEAARQAGSTRVMSQGEFSSKLPQILGRKP